MPEERELRSTSLDFYIGFDHLSAHDFGRLLVSCGRMFDLAYESYAGVPPGVLTERPFLEVSEVHTGDSIKFKFTERAVPTVSFDGEDDVVVGVPRKLGIPLLMASLLLGAAGETLKIQNDYYDREIKKIDLQLKQEELNKNREHHETRAPEELEKESNQIMASLLDNPSFKTVSINGVTIKGTDPSDDSRKHQRQTRSR